MIFCCFYAYLHEFLYVLTGVLEFIVTFVWFIQRKIEYHDAFNYYSPNCGIASRGR